MDWYFVPTPKSVQQTYFFNSVGVSRVFDVLRYFDRTIIDTFENLVKDQNTSSSKIL